MRQFSDLANRAITWISGAHGVGAFPAQTAWAHMMGVADFHVAMPEDVRDVTHINDLLHSMPEWRLRMPELARAGGSWATVAVQWERLIDDPEAIRGMVTVPRRTAAEKLLRVAPFFEISGPQPDWPTLRERYLAMTFEQRVCDWIVSADTGASSTAVWRQMIGISYPPSRMPHPHDPADLGRCLRLLRLFPEWNGRITEMRRAGAEWEALSERWDELAATMMHEVGINWEKAKSAPRTYDLMKAILGEAKQQKGMSA